MVFGCGLLEAGEVPLRYTDLAHPSITQRVEAATEGVRNAKFVKVDVVAITNPKEVALSFDVYFMEDGGSRLWLGSFGPFPADNPGQFIVPTKGRVRPGGSIIVVMAVPGHAAVPENAKIEAAIGQISLVP